MMKYTIAILVLCSTISCVKKDALPNCMHDNSCTPEVYYDALKSQCKGGSCCEASVEHMKKNGFKKSATCPPFSKLDQMKCPTSYQWCAPTN